MEGKPKKIVILAFNAGIAGKVVNGPGISLRNFLVFSKRYSADNDFTVFSSFPIKSESGISAKLFRIKDSKQLLESIRSCDLVHCWSGLYEDFAEAIILANKLSKPVILGPNMLDYVQRDKEKDFLSKVEFEILLTANTRLKYKLQRLYNLSPDKVFDFMVGPDPNLWAANKKSGGYILWKGNGNQVVKDLKFAKRVSKALPEYKFVFLGEKTPYDYLKHIPVAKAAELYINTSLSETKGMAQLEQMMAGVPSVTHPDIFCHGINYKTGIVVNRSPENYICAIKEILTNNSLKNDLSFGAIEYAQQMFGPENILAKYEEIIKRVI